MRRFLYYFPGVTGINATMLAEFGALDRFTFGAQLDYSGTPINDGPDGAGVVVATGAQPPDLSTVAWQRGEKFSVGIETLPPGPDDLERDPGVAGYEMPLGDGNSWRIPLALKWDTDRHVVNVPASLSMIGGKIETRPKPQFARIGTIAGAAFEAYCRSETIPAETLYPAAAALLATNYRIGIEEMNLLCLIEDNGKLAELLGLSFDLPGLQHAASIANTRGLQRSKLAQAAEGAN